MAQTATFHDDGEPKLFHALRSVNSDKWIASIYNEFDVLIINKTWTDVQHRPPLNSEILLAWIVFKIRHDSAGNVSKYKAWLVVRGNLQSDESDYNSVYALVAWIELASLLSLLWLSVVKKYEAHQLDIKGAFLNASLPETDKIWIRLRKTLGARIADVCLIKLVKSLYGFRQAPKSWYQN